MHVLRIALVFIAVLLLGIQVQAQVSPAKPGAANVAKKPQPAAKPAGTKTQPTAKQPAIDKAAQLAAQRKLQQAAALDNIRRLSLQMGWLQQDESELPYTKIVSSSDTAATVLILNYQHLPWAVFDVRYTNTRIRKVEIQYARKLSDEENQRNERSYKNGNVVTLQPRYDSTKGDKITAIDFHESFLNGRRDVVFVYSGDTLKLIKNIEHVEEGDRLWTEAKVDKNNIVARQSFAITTGSAPHKMVKYHHATYQYDSAGRLIMVFAKNASSPEFYDLTRIKYLPNGAVQGVLKAYDRAFADKCDILLFTYDEKGVVKEERRYESYFENFIKPDFSFETFIENKQPTIYANEYNADGILTRLRSTYESKCLDKYIQYDYTYNAKRVLDRCVVTQDVRTKCQY